MRIDTLPKDTFIDENPYHHWRSEVVEECLVRQKQRLYDYQGDKKYLAHVVIATYKSGLHLCLVVKSQ
jgi:hypothetical protein